VQVVALPGEMGHIARRKAVRLVNRDHCGCPPGVPSFMSGVEGRAIQRAYGWRHAAWGNERRRTVQSPFRRGTMRAESVEVLQALVETGAPSGYEQPVQRLFRQYVGDYAAEVRTDVMGNAIAIAQPDGAPRVMLAGHADEIGFLVQYINDEGYIYFAPVGGWDA